MPSPAKDLGQFAGATGIDKRGCRRKPAQEKGANRRVRGQFEQLRGAGRLEDGRTHVDLDAARDSEWQQLVEHFLRADRTGRSRGTPFRGHEMAPFEG